MEVLPEIQKKNCNFAAKLGRHGRLVKGYIIRMFADGESVGKRGADNRVLCQSGHAVCR